MVHFVDYVSPLNPWKLKSEVDNPFSISFSRPRVAKKKMTICRMCLCFLPYSLRSGAVLCLLFWFLYFQNPAEKGAAIYLPKIRHFFLCKIVAHAYIPWESVIRNNEFWHCISALLLDWLYILLTRIFCILRQESKQYFSCLFYWYQFYCLLGNYISSIAVYTGLLYLLILVFYIPVISPEI